MEIIALDVFIDLSLTVSLSLSIVYFLYGAEILYLWFPATLESFRSGRTSAPDKLARGIFAGFLTGWLDSFYWFVTWYFLRYELEPVLAADASIGATMLFYGVVANIFFRQLGGIYSAKQHTDAANEMHRGAKPVHHIFYWFAGIFSFIALNQPYLT